MKNRISLNSCSLSYECFKQNTWVLQLVRKTLCPHFIPDSDKKFGNLTPVQKSFCDSIVCWTRNLLIRSFTSDDRSCRNLGKNMLPMKGIKRWNIILPQGIFKRNFLLSSPFIMRVSCPEHFHRFFISYFRFQVLSSQLVSLKLDELETSYDEKFNRTFYFFSKFFSIQASISPVRLKLRPVFWFLYLQ